MDAEELLKSFGWRADCGRAKDRILRAARRARFESRLWRATWLTAAAVMGVAIPLNLFVNHIPSDWTNATTEPEVEVVVRSLGDEAWRTRVRMALIPPAGAGPRMEVP